MRKKLKMKFMIVLIVVILAFVAAFLVVIPPGKGELPAFKDADGNLITKSIAEKTYVAEARVYRSICWKVCMIRNCRSILWSAILTIGGQGFHLIRRYVRKR